jgi:hypothetical protein
MTRPILLVAGVAGLALIHFGCSSDSGSPSAPSGSSSNLSPPSVDLGGDGTTSGTTSEEPSSGTSSTGAKPAPGGWGSLAGRFVYDGPAPEPTPLSITKDQEFCGKHQLVNEELVVNSENGGIKNVVVMLYVKPREKAPQAHPDYAEALKTPVRLDNVGCRFEPHIVPVQTGQQLIVGNKDEVGHNTNVAFQSGTPFNEVIAAGGEIQKSISAAERLPTPAACNIHPWMRAYVVVTEHPYVAVSDENGDFKIENLPTGEWTFQIWQEKTGYIENAQRDGKEQSWKNGRTEFAIHEGENELGEIKIKPAALE